MSPRTPLFDAITGVCRSMVESPIVVPSLTAGMTDLRYLRAKGATAYGWVPLVLEADDLATIHGHDERIEVRAFERAVDVMTQVVREASL